MHAAKKKPLRFLILLLLIYGRFDALAQQDTLPPFSIELEVVDAPSLPGLHSFAKAISGDKWLIVSGRVDGLHSFYPNSAFAPTEANQMIYVVDTDDWQIWSAPLQLLSYSIRTSLKSTNTQFFQDGAYLYVIGGYGYDSLIDSKITFPTLTALEIDEVINEIVSGAQNLSPFIRQISDPAFAITGGGLQKIGNTFFLAGGHNFSGLYTKLPSSTFVQAYTNSITSFQIDDDGVNLTISDYTQQIDTLQFHRRDLNVAPLIYADGSEGLGVYGGVFRYDKNLPYLHPIYIQQGIATTDLSFEQKMSQYTCPVITIYDSVNQTMHTTFFGGISLYDFIDSINQVVEDTLVPFIEDITTLSRNADEITTEAILPVKFQDLAGANADFFPSHGIPQYDNGVIKLNQIGGKQLIGYIYGGINSNKPNEGYTNASNQVYRVFLTPSISTSAESAFAVSPFSIIPNPANTFTRVQFTLNSVQRIRVQLINMFGEEVLSINEIKYSIGTHQLQIETADLNTGMYTLLLVSEDKTDAIKLMVSK